MTQPIDPLKLKASAEHLEWVLKQYPDSDDVQGLLRAVLPLIEDAKAGKVLEPVEGRDIPGAYNYGDGVYVPYKDPSVGGAYADFITEMEGGLTEVGKQIRARIEAAKRALKEGSES